MELEKFLREKNLTDSEFARQLGVNKSNIVIWKRGRRLPRIDTAVKMCEILDISLSELIGYRSTKLPKQSPAMSRKLYQVVTMNGRWDAAYYYRQSTRLLGLTGGKVNPLVRLFRSVANTLEEIEIIQSKPQKLQAFTGFEQLNLFSLL